MSLTERDKNRFQRLGALSALSVILFVFLYLFWGWSLGVSGRRFLSLLEGSDAVSVVKFEIVNQKRKLVCLDQKVCEYVTRMLREAERADVADGGISCQGVFTLSTGDRYVVTNMEVQGFGFCPSIPEARPREYGLPTHIVSFVEPVPDRLNECWITFREPSDGISYARSPCVEILIDEVGEVNRKVVKAISW